MIDTRMPPTRLSASRRAALAVGLPLVAALVAYTALGLVGLMGRVTVDDNATYPVPATRHLQISTRGDITINVGDGPGIRVHRTSSFGISAPRHSADVDGAGLRLASSCPWWDVFDCAVSYDVVLPAGVSADLATGSGSIHVTGTDGAVTAHTGSGSIRADRTTGALSLDTGSGSITTTSTSGDMALSTGSGSISATGVVAARTSARAGSGGIRLDFAAAPREVSAHTGSGSEVIEVPAGSGPYRVDGTTGSGTRTIDVRTDPAASATIIARTGSGDVTVRESGR